MRVKLQLVMCSDEGQEEIVTEVITLNKNNQRLEHLGLTLAEAKESREMLGLMPPQASRLPQGPYPDTSA
jgi:hypothetical protein